MANVSPAAPSKHRRNAFETPGSVNLSDQTLSEFGSHSMCCLAPHFPSARARLSHPIFIFIFIFQGAGTPHHGARGWRHADKLDRNVVYGTHTIVRWANPRTGRRDLDARTCLFHPSPPSPPLPSTRSSRRPVVCLASTRITFADMGPIVIRRDMTRLVLEVAPCR